METFVFLAALVSLAIWGCHALLHNPFWLDEEPGVDGPSDGRAWPGVVALVDARGQAEALAEAVESLLGQNYPGPFHVILIDDGRRGTRRLAAEAAAADAAARLSTVGAGMPRPGEARDLAPYAAGLAEAQRRMPGARYFWLTDGGTTHWQNTLTEMVTRAEGGELDVVSNLPMFACESFIERLLVPAFAFFFQKRTPFVLVNGRWSRRAAVSRASVLIRSDALAAAGGAGGIGNLSFPAFAGRLKQAARRRGRGVWIGLSEETARAPADDWRSSIDDALRIYATDAGSLSPVRAIWRALGFTLAYLVPPLSVIWALWAAFFVDLDNYLSGYLALLAGSGAWAAMAFSAVPTYRLHGQPEWMTALLPLAALARAVLGTSSGPAKAADGNAGQPAAGWAGKRSARPS